MELKNNLLNNIRYVILLLVFVIGIITAYFYIGVQTNNDSLSNTSPCFNDAWQEREHNFTQKNTSEYYINRGLDHLKCLEYQMSIDEFNKSINVSGDDSKKYDWLLTSNFYIGFINFEIGNLEESLKYYSTAIEYSGNSTVRPKWELYRNKATVLAKLSKYNEAISDYTKAIELNPNLWKLYKERSDAYTALDMLDEAVLDLEMSEKIKRSN
ncbi:MAG: hypothetical protein CL758_07780 [Chloroflexi bacterium]|nr:hypothetical protein [Chloroflexota bacterium]|tara:strand:+ start:247 stop:882 length:636 start_codon:yes stop_codon:yes gene_type:complete